MTPMEKAVGSLRKLSRGQLVSLALAYLESHQRSCELLGQEPPDHAAFGEVSDRVAKLTDDELVEFLMPISALGHSD
jgi:hypothetical protein